MKREKGAAAIEFTIVGLMLVTLLIGGLDCARAFVAAISVENAARAGIAFGLRNAAKAGDLPALEKAALDQAALARLDGLQATARQVCRCQDGGETSCGADRCAPLRRYVEVTAKAPYHTMGAYPFLPNPMILSSKVSIRLH